MRAPRERLLSAVCAVVGRVLALGALVVGRRAKYVEVLIEVYVYLAAVVFGDLDLVVALFVAALGAGNTAVHVLERDALGFLDVGCATLPQGVFAGTGRVSHTRTDQQQRRDHRRQQPRPRVHVVNSFASYTRQEYWLRT